MSPSARAPRGPVPRGARASFDFTVIGGGIVGLATARALLEANVGSVRAIEKESARRARARREG